ncbi:glutamyl-tRNA reductase [Anaerotalea alkaliphila]|uniref:Glutamyl-tRNA reductase n=1 Tax=Anaerotalea alkaliphila TaxID=2662126 RepID=A0A7X5HTA5_9FIRM|nr:glutamyl-tRNA reductase [Anaerotalea alkaliphila]
MHIGVVGISHQEGGVEIREAFSFTESKKIEFLNLLLDMEVEEAVVLGTCNRSEVYFTTGNLETASQVKGAYLEFFRAWPLEPFLFEKRDKEAVAHLFRVAAGLDSVVLGEDQILCQVKDAWELAGETGARKKVMNRVFLEAVTFAKRMKAAYRIGETPLSIPSVAVKLLGEELDLTKAQVLVIGAGEMGRLAIRYLAAAGAARIHVSNRNRCKADDLAATCPQCRTVPYEERYGILGEMDVVVCATSSPHIILNRKEFPPRKKPVHLLDMAVPMDIERSIGELPGVVLWDVDDFQARSMENRKQREEAARQMESQVEGQVEVVWEWLAKTRVDPIIASFHDVCDQSREDTMRTIRKKIPLNHREYLLLEKLLDSAIRRVVREPIRQLKALEDVEEMDAYKAMIHKLYDW